MTKLTALVFVSVLMASLILGYSGNPSAKQAGNTILLIGLVLCLPLAAVGAVLWAVGRQPAQ